MTKGIQRRGFLVIRIPIGMKRQRLVSQIIYITSELLQKTDVISEGLSPPAAFSCTL